MTAAEREAAARAAYVAEVVASAPRLSDETADRVARLLRPSKAATR